MDWSKRGIFQEEDRTFFGGGGDRENPFDYEKKGGEGGKNYEREKFFLQESEKATFTQWKKNNSSEWEGKRSQKVSLSLSKRIPFSLRGKGGGGVGAGYHTWSCEKGE